MLVSHVNFRRLVTPYSVSLVDHNTAADGQGRQGEQDRKGKWAKARAIKFNPWLLFRERNTRLPLQPFVRCIGFDGNFGVKCSGNSSLDHRPVEIISRLEKCPLSLEYCVRSLTWSDLITVQNRGFCSYILLTQFLLMELVLWNLWVLKAESCSSFEICFVLFDFVSCKVRNVELWLTSICFDL